MLNQRLYFVGDDEGVIVLLDYKQQELSWLPEIRAIGRYWHSDRTGPSVGLIDNPGFAEPGTDLNNNQCENHIAFQNK